MSKTRFDKVGPTAWIVAYRRSLSDIPFAEEIYYELEVSGTNSSLDPDLLQPRLAPQIEARHKIVSLYLKRTGIKQVLDLASGLSPRGVHITKEKSFNYVEFDLPEMIENKSRIIDSLISKGICTKRSNLHFAKGNALALDDLVKATKIFSQDKELCVVNEGLMRYLTMEERATLAKNIYALLQKFGGVWITPDISLKRVLADENERDKVQVQRVSEMTGIDIIANRI